MTKSCYTSMMVLQDC